MLVVHTHTALDIYIHSTIVVLEDCSVHSEDATQKRNVTVLVHMWGNLSLSVRRPLSGKHLRKITDSAQALSVHNHFFKHDFFRYTMDYSSRIITAQAQRKHQTRQLVYSHQESSVYGNEFIAAVQLLSRCLSIFRHTIHQIPMQSSFAQKSVVLSLQWLYRTHGPHSHTDN